MYAFETINDTKCWPSQDIVAPLAAREIKGKKRERESEEDCDENKTTTTGELENICPNGGVEKTTPVRKARGQSKGAQKLFSSGADATKIKGTGERLHVVQGEV